jgi:HAD superfamily hydrolase (TIGR01450 family)
MAVADNFDVFLCDLYGVLWDGARFYPGVLEVLQKLRQVGKVVGILSNSGRLTQSEKTKEMQKGIHYDDFFTAGIVAGEFLRETKLSFNSCSHPRKFYTVGVAHDNIFRGTVYESVAIPEEADFIFFALPLVSTSEKETFPQFSDSFFSDQQKPEYWDTCEKLVFTSQLRRLNQLSLPAFNVNSDKAALVLDRSSNTLRTAIRSGTLADIYRQGGGEVLEISKPYRIVYDFALSHLLASGGYVTRDRILMVGDTLKTDIWGARNAGIKSALVIKTGLTAIELASGATLEMLCYQERIRPDLLLESVAD